jgi:hypothetical protein
MLMNPMQEAVKPGTRMESSWKGRFPILHSRAALDSQPKPSRQIAAILRSAGFTSTARSLWRAEGKIMNPTRTSHIAAFADTLQYLDNLSLSKYSSTKVFVAIWERCQNMMRSL